MTFNRYSRDKEKLGYGSVKQREREEIKYWHFEAPFHQFSFNMFYLKAGFLVKEDEMKRMIGR